MDPADPFVAGERGDVLPGRQSRRVAVQCVSKVLGKFMDDPARDVFVIDHAALNRIATNVRNGWKADITATNAPR